MPESTHLEQIKDKISHFRSIDELQLFVDTPDDYIEGEPDAYLEGYKIGVEAGAIWQKEQDKELAEVAERALNYLNTKYPKEAEILHDLKNCITKYNNL